MPGATGTTVALETTDGVGDTDAWKTRLVTSVEVRYSPDEGRDWDMGVRGRELDEGELDEDDEREEDMGVDGVGEDGYWINGSVSIKLGSSE